jgi:hypothetical protein
MPGRIPRTENWGSMIISSGIQLMRKISRKGPLATKKMTSGNSEDGALDGDGVQADQQGETEAAKGQEVAPQESSGSAGQGPYNPEGLNQRVKHRVVEEPYGPARKPAERRSYHVDQKRFSARMRQKQPSISIIDGDLSPSQTWIRRVPRVGLKCILIARARQVPSVLPAAEGVTI